MASAAVRGRKTLGYNGISILLKMQTKSAETYFRERMGFDLWEFMLHIIRVHGLDLLPRRCSQNLDNLHQLVDAALAREQGLTQHQLSHDTSS
jgi:hypothetical protein